jgi:hypothetical protein
MTSASSDNYNCDIGTINGCMIQTEGAEESKAAGPVSCGRPIGDAILRERNPFVTGATLRRWVKG